MQTTCQNIYQVEDTRKIVPQRYKNTVCKQGNNKTKLNESEKKRGSLCGTGGFGKTLLWRGALVTKRKQNKAYSCGALGAAFFLVADFLGAVFLVAVVFFFLGAVFFFGANFLADFFLEEAFFLGAAAFFLEAAFVLGLAVIFFLVSAAILYEFFT